MMNYDDIFVLNRERQGSESVLRRFDNGALGTMEIPESPEEIDRREAVLNARIGEFENLVRKTKFSMAERLENLTNEEKKWSAKWDELREAIDSLTARETDLARREVALKDQLAGIAKKEAALRKNEEEFQGRSEEIIRRIGEQKEELTKLISLHLGR